MTQEPETRSQVDEPVVAVMPNVTLMRGFLGIGSRQHTLVLTKRRIIFARMTTQMMKEMTAEARDSAKADGKGFFGQWGAQIAAGLSFAARYLEMSPEDVLAEHPANFAIEADSIVKSRLKAGGAGNANVAASPDELIIKTKGKKYKMHLGAGVGQAREALVEAELI